MNEVTPEAYLHDMQIRLGEQIAENANCSSTLIAEWDGAVGVGAPAALREIGNGLRNAVNRLSAELAEVRAENERLKAAKWDVKHTNTMNDLVQMGMARDAAEASAREAWEALESSMVAVDDWLHTYASDLCDREAVAKSSKRIMEAGGTLAYIAGVQDVNRSAIRAKVGV